MHPARFVDDPEQADVITPNGVLPNQPVEIFERRGVAEIGFRARFFAHLVEKPLRIRRQAEATGVGEFDDARRFRITQNHVLLAARLRVVEILRRIEDQATLRDPGAEDFGLGASLLARTAR